MTAGLLPTQPCSLTGLTTRWWLFAAIFCFAYLGAASANTAAADVPAGERFSSFVQPPEYMLNPGSGKRVEFIYRGLRNVLPARVNIPNSSNVEKVYIEVVYKGKLPATSLHSAVEATLQDGSNVKLTPKLIKGQWGQNSGVGVFFAEVGKTDRVSLNFEVEEASAQSVLLYVLRNDALPGVYQAGTYASFYGYNTTVDFSIPLPPDTRNRDITVTIPVTEITTDNRVLDFEISAGGVSKQFRRAWPSGFSFDNECCIDSVQTVLHGVTGSAAEVLVKIISPPSVGQSFVVSGLVQAEVRPTCAPLTITLPQEVCTDNTVVIESARPGSGYTATWDFGPGAMPRTHQGFGKVYVMFSTAGRQDISVEVTGPDCTSSETHFVDVETCNTSTCALEAANVIQHPAHGNDDGVIELDMCVSCGSTPPYRVFYTYQGQVVERGPFDAVKPKLTGLTAGTYSMMYVIDARGCRTNVTGPVTLCKGGCGQVPTCPDATCTLTGFVDRGIKRTLWLPSLGFDNPRFRWQDGAGTFTVTDASSALITGKVVSIEDPSCGFDVTLVLRNRKNWNDWSALGRDWKGNRSNINNNQHTTWDYYELVANQSQLQGFGCWTGTLALTPRPADYRYGVQVGEGANDQNLSPGLSAWFGYAGKLNGTSYAGEGDINDEGTCRLTDLRRNATPILSCGADFAVACGGSPDDAPPPTINCGDPDDYTLTYEDREISTNPRKIERTWTATGPGGPATCRQLITFGDNTPPVFTKVPTEDRMLCGDIRTQTAEATDDCGTATVTFRETKFNESCPGTYDLRRVWTATDESGNASTAELIVHIVDEQGPDFMAAPQDVIIECKADLPTDRPNALDACSEPVTIDYAITSCEAATPIYTWRNGELEYLTESAQPTATYPAGMQALVLSATCSDAPSQRRRYQISNPNNFDVYVTRIVAGATSVYEGLLIPADAQVMFFVAAQAGQAASISWTDAAGIEQQASQQASSAQCDLSAAETCTCVYTRTWTAEDACGNTSVYQQKVWQRDTKAPTLRNIPADRTYAAGTAIPAAGNVTATDECTAASVQMTEVSIPSAAYGCDEAAVHYLYGWRSVNLPVLTINGRNFRIGQTPLAVQESCGGFATISGTVVDANDPRASFEVRISLKDRRTFSAHTAAGGDAPTSCSQADKNTWRFYKIDPAGSQLIGRGSNSGITLAISPLQGEEWLQLGAGANSNNCKVGLLSGFSYRATAGSFPGSTGTWRGAVSSVHFTETEACEASYTLIRIWTATDDCGNSAIERQVIRITDTEEPTFDNVPSNTSINCSEPLPTATVTASDEGDDDVEVTLTEQEAGDACAKTLTRTWTATDDCGNSKTARQVITIRDQTGPEITFSNPTINDLNSGDLLVVSCSDIPTIDESIARLTDDCDPAPTVKFTDEPLGVGDCRSDGFRERYRCTWTATDRCGNQTVFFLIVELHDDQPPVFTQVPEAFSQSCGTSLPTTQPRVTDNCSSNPQLEETTRTVTGSCTDAYEVVRLWTASDDCGNTATASQVITITDNSPPVLENVPEAITLACDESLPTEQPIASDGCDNNVRLVESSTTRAGACAYSYTLVRLWTATDNCGNVATASQVVTVEDKSAPTITFSNQLLTGFTDGQELIVDCDDVPTFGLGDVAVSDNCDTDVSIDFIDDLVAEGDCENAGFVRHFYCTWTATDNCGNTTSISIHMKVRDVQAPTLTSVPGDISISCDQGLPTSQPTISDNCTDDSALLVTETSTREDGACADSYRVIRLWTATDRCGNAATASQVITVGDAIRPVLAQIPESVTISCEEDLPSTLPTATDNCDVDVQVTVTDQNSPNGCPGSFSVIRTFTASDNCGNTATASQVVTVRDLTAPVLTQVPTATTVACDGDLPTSQPIASDNCDTDVAIVESSQQRPGNCPDSYEVIRQWTATDNCGNKATASQVVTIRDEVAPVLSALPQNLTIRCDQSLPTNRPSATDNCDADVTVAETQETRAGACANSYEVVRLFTASDNCGNTATGSQVVTVTDDVAPYFTGVPANATIACDGQVPADLPTAADNCDGQVAVIESQGTSPGNCPGAYDLIRTFTATDKCGNSATASQVVTVQDLIEPTFSYVPANFASSCDESIPSEQPQVSDNCDTDVNVSERQETRPGTCAGTYDIVRIFTATDDCGNVATASQVISFFDDEKPSFVGVPAAITLACDDALPSDTPTAQDNCDTDVDVVLDEERLDGPCADSYKVIRRWTATDHCGNKATTSQVVSVQDLTTPIFTSVPPAMTISCSQNLPTEQAVASDNCDADVTLTERQRTEPGACVNGYRVIREWSATDNCGNVATASQVVTVEDMGAPVFADVPSSITIACDAPLPSIGPNVSDNCDDDVAINETQSTQPGACADSYTVVRTWTATDNCGNVATASQVVNVEDSNSPIFSFVPATVTIDCDASLPADQPEVEDNCDASVTVAETQLTQAGSCGGAHAVIRTWTATDNCGNTATASQLVNVQDISAPVFASVPAATVIECDDDVPVSQPTVSDNCDDNVTVSETQRTVAGSCAGNYQLIRTWTATDGCGNVATAEQVVDVQDTEGPVFTQVPEAITLSCDEAIPTTEASATDNCDSDVQLSTTEVRTDGSCAGSFVVVRTFLATDHCGNAATASQVVTFQDNVPPTFAAVPGAVTIACNDAFPTTAPTASDNCDAAVAIEETSAIVPGACADAYRLIRTWTATDACGNVATASQVVQVEDVQAPSFVQVPATVTIECSDALPTDLASATDNCDTDVAVVVSERREAGGCTDSYVVVRVFTATDNCGNTSSAEQRVEVIDSTVPVFTDVPTAITIGCDESLPTELATATDNCNTQVTVTETQERRPGACTNAYTLIRTFTATDNCGNSARASQEVTVQDIDAPELSGVPRDLTIACDEPLPTSAPVATDDCDTQVTVVETQTNEPGDCADSYVVLRTWVATDACGNSATAVQRVTRTDDVAPQFVSVPVGVVIACDAALPTDLPVARDNCADDVTITEVQATQPGACANAYSIVRTFTATDGCGNTATASQVVEVQDLTPPSFIAVPVATTVACDASLPTDAPATSDSCDDAVDVVETQDYLAGACAGSYRVIRIWTATDDCGNTATATQLINVVDDVAPVFVSVPENISLGCDEELPSDLPAATDACDDDVHIAETQQRLPGGCADSYTLIRTFTATDHCGNTATATQAVTIEDASIPAFENVPEDLELSCDEQLPDDQPSATDACDAQVTVSEARETIAGPCAGAYTIIRTWTATDNCGNTAQVSQQIQVGDRSEPTFTNVPAEVTVSCDEDLPTDQPVAIDNCDNNIAITETSERLTGACADSYSIIRTWTASDDCGNVATATQRVRVEDKVAPTFVSVPPAVTISCEQDLPTTQPRANDNCATDVTLTERTDRDRGACPDSYSITRIWTATDNCGNSSTASQVVTIQDSTAPEFANVPPSVTIDCDAATPDAEPTASDNCDDQVRIRADERRIDGACSDSYQLLRTWTAEDDCGNTATITQVITVIDPTAPVFAQVPPPVTITCDQAMPTSLPVANDNCDTDVSIAETQETLPGPCPDSYEVIRTWTISDNCGNTARATQLVTILDSGKPIFTRVPASRTVSCDEDPGDDEPVASDDCDTDVAITLTETTSGDDCSRGIQLVRIWTATDNCGNTATASQTITFEDREPPVFGPLDRTLTVECDQPVPLIIPTATDLCDREVDVMHFDNREELPCGATITRTWVASDDCGNTTSATQLVVIRDSQQPVLTGIPASTQLSCTDLVPAANVTAADNCATNLVVELEEFEVPGRCPGEQTLTRIWTATDDCGNAATGSQVITISDGGLPTLVDVPAQVTIGCQDPLPTALPTASDACSGTNSVTLEEIQRTEPGNCPDSYRIVRVFTASDACGNTSTASQVVNVVDNSAPTFTSTPASVTITCGEQIPEADALASDDCDQQVDVSLQERRIAGSCDDEYDLLRLWTATDNCGNTATASQTITVVDEEPPSFTTVSQDVTLSCNEPIPTGAAEASDGCDDDVTISMVEEQIPGASANEYTLVRTWTAVDNCGNTATASQTIAVAADGIPSFTFVPENISLGCGDALPNADARAIDDCDGDIAVSLTQTRIDGSCATNYQIVRTWTAEDVDGNVVSAQQTITVEDRVAPAFTEVPADVTLACGDAAPTNMALAIDACDPNVVVTVDEAPRSGACASESQIVRTFTARDACGNAVTAEQVVTFTDTQAPVFSFVPNSEEYQCSISQPREQAKATDNCTSNVRITFVDASASADCSQRLQRIWTATDDCGNTATAVQQILLEDTENPELINVPQNTTIDLTTGGTVPAPANVRANDNCDISPNVQLVEDSQPSSGCGYTLIRTWTATDQCGNTARATQRISVIEDLGVGIRVDPAAGCAPSGIQLHAVPASAGTSYSWTASAGSFDNPQAKDPVFIPAGAGTYTINLTAQGTGCSGTASEEVTVNGTTLSVSSNSPLCTGETIQLTASAGAQQYAWSGPNGFSSTAQSPTIADAGTAAAGVYTLTADFGDCTQEANVTVDVGKNLSLQLDMPSLVCANSELKLSAGGVANATWTSPSGLTLSGATVTTAPVSFAAHNGQWTVTASSASGCTATETFSIKVVRQPVVSASSNTPVCAGGELQLQATGGTAYTWSGPAGFSSTQAAPRISDLSNYPTGTYTFTVVGDNVAGCLDTATTEVVVSAGGQLVLNAPSTVCTGEAIQFSATGADSYVWSGPDNFSSLESTPQLATATAAASGTYTVVAEFNNGCQARESFILDVVEELVTDATVRNTTCDAKGAILLNLPGSASDYIIDWSDLPASSDPADRLELVEGSYTVSVTAFGCTRLYSYTVANGCNPTACTFLDQDEVLVENPSCGAADGRIAYPAATSGYSYTWQPAVSTGPEATGLAAGSYSLTVSQQNSPACDTTYIFTLESAPGCACSALNSIIRAAELDVCLAQAGAEIGVVTVTEPRVPADFKLAYLLVDVADAAVLRSNNNGTFTVSDAGTFSIHQLIYEERTLSQNSFAPGKSIPALEQQLVQGGGNICGALTTFGARIKTDQCCVTPEVVSVTTQDAGCTAHNGVVDIQLAGSAEDYIYSWMPDAGAQLGQFDNTRGSLASGTYDVTITNRVDASCSVSVTAYVGVNELAAGLPLVNAATCGESDGRVVFNGGSPALTYSWSDGGSGLFRNNLAAGDYTVEVTDGDADCRETFQFTVGSEADLGLAVQVIANPDCGTANGAAMILTANGSRTYSYSWAGDATRNDLAGGTYTVGVTDVASGCTDSITFTLNEQVQAGVTIDVTDVELLCNGAANGTPQFELDYDDGFKFPPTMSFVDSRGEPATFGELGPGEYCLTIRDAEDCLAGSNCFQVTEPRALNVNVTALPADCEDTGSIRLAILGGTPPYRFDWADLPAASDPQNRTDLAHGQYTVFITDANGCASAVNNINIARNCGCSPTLPELVEVNEPRCFVAPSTLIGTRVESTTSDPGMSSIYLLTNSNGVIVQLASQPEFLISSQGSYTIHGMVYNPQAYSTNTITLGQTRLADLNAQFVQGGGFICAGLDLVGVRVEVEACSDCTASVGALSIDGPTIWCTDNGLASVLNLRVDNSTGVLVYVVVDEAGQVVKVSANPAVDIAGLSGGSYSVYAVATASAATSPVLGQDFLPLTGCADISQAIVVTALTGSDCNSACQVAAGTVTDIAPRVVCVDVLPTTLAVTASGITGSEQRYLITSMSGTITSIQALDGTLELSSSSTVGTFRVYLLAYEQPVQGLRIGGSLGNLDGCFALSTPTTITIAGGSACGQQPTWDTVRFGVPVSQTEQACAMLDAGLDLQSTTFTLAGAGGATGQSSFGSWAIDASGCLVYTASTTPGIDVEVITVVATDGVVVDTNVYIVSVLSQNPTREQVEIRVPVFETENACPAAIPAAYSNVSAALILGNSSGASRFGTYSLATQNGCLSFTALGTSGLGVDTVEVQVCDIDLQACHIVSYVISVLPKGDSISRSVPQGDTLVLCAPASLLFGAAQIPTICEQPTVGTLTYEATTQCFVYTAPTNFVGAVSVCIEVCDDQGICVQRNVSIDVLPPCGNIISDSAAGVVVSDCDDFGSYCLPLANAIIGNYALSLDGQPYRSTSTACAGGAGTSILADTGSHQLIIEELATSCSDTVALVVGCADCGLSATPATLEVNECDQTADLLLNLLQGNWSRYSFTLNGDDAADLLRSAGTRTSIAVDTGRHTLIVRSLDNSCLELIEVNVTCSSTGSVADLERTIRVSFSDTVCVADFGLSSSDAVTSVADVCPGTLDGGEAAIEFDLATQCLTYTGLLPGIDSLCLQVCTATGCDTISFTVTVLPTSVRDQNIVIPIGTTASICLDTTELAAPITEVFNFCPDASGTAVGFDIDEDTYCITYSGATVGTEQGCFVICNAIACDTTFITVTVQPLVSNEPPVAVDDAESTTKGMPIDINVLRNDTLNGALEQISPVSLPNNGNLFIVSDSIIRYTPDAEFCGGVDSFRYIISNGLAFDTASVRIEVACDELVVFSGLSPNGDGINDQFRILGIEAFPANTVMIFNRWGNEVYNRRGYTNDPDIAFDGRWEGKTLTNGTYFYVIDLGGDAGCLSGYVQIAR